MSDKRFSYLFVEDVFYVDLLSEMEIPHYTNESRGDTEPRCFRVRTIDLPNEEPDEDEESFTPTQLIVFWNQGDTEPTDEEILNDFEGVAP